MHRGRFAALCLGLAGMSWAALLAAQAPAAPSGSSPVSFSKDIFPVLDSNCLACHGEGLQLSKLDLRTREGALRGGEHGAAIVPGNAEQSRLFRLISGLEKPAMPLDSPSLAPEEIARIKAWIEQGAQWDAVAANASTPGGFERAGRPREHGDHTPAAQLLGVQAPRASAPPASRLALARQPG